ncbi:MFS transporter [Streptomyces sp. NRRL F-5135]|uniref:MFS transporter n=1 Tax=Streptomyces sp. NRRL F-5135 TaxID=1463858 RepID=UPI0007C53502|nr:MFS transporter [Streptomyces sp. NRRL F-5135]
MDITGCQPQPLPPARVRKARLATFIGFFQLGAMILVWSTSTTPLRNHLGWDGAQGDSDFGMLALAIGIGSAVGCFVIGPFLDRFGPRRTATLTMVVYPLAYIPLAFLQGFGATILIGVLVGLWRGAGDTAINAHGVQVERHYGQPLMSAFHAAYPAGGFLLGLVGSAFARHYASSPAMSYVVLGVLMSVVGLLAGRWLLGQDELLPASAPAQRETPAAKETRTSEDAKASKAATATVLLMLGFGVLLLGSMLSEGSLLDWGQEFVRRTTGADAALAATGVSLYSGAQFVGRLFGDRLANRFGARVVVGASGVIGAAGALVALSAATTFLALTGFVLMGLGLSCMAPLMLSAAGRYDPANAGRNIGLVNAVGFCGMLVGPAAITLVVDAFGIRWMPVLSVLLLGLIALCGPLLMRTASTTPSRGPDPDGGGAGRQEAAAEVV